MSIDRTVPPPNFKAFLAQIPDYNKDEAMRVMDILATTMKINGQLQPTHPIDTMVGAISAAFAVVLAIRSIEGVPTDKDDPDGADLFVDILNRMRPILDEQCKDFYEMIAEYRKQRKQRDQHRESSPNLN